jgi:16S rRNA (guanine1516-N2)-methyltransferase
LPREELKDKFNNKFKMKFTETELGLSLHTSLGDLRLDFVNDKANYQRPLKKGKNEIIARAIGLNKKCFDVIDLTAGLGQDAVVLARLGCTVRAVERSPWIYPLLQDAKKRAFGKLEWIDRLSFHEGEAAQYLKNMSVSYRPQVIYLDPMFPEKKKKALPRKEMQIFRELIGEDPDAGELLQLALQFSTERVVVKRPLKAPDLGPGVVHRFEGSSVRYDLYLTNN